MSELADSIQKAQNQAQLARISAESGNRKAALKRARKAYRHLGEAIGHDVEKAWRSKPDTDEPWRYVCPDCVPDRRSQVHHTSGNLYECQNCGWSGRKHELHDQRAEGGTTA